MMGDLSRMHSNDLSHMPYLGDGKVKGESWEVKVRRTYLDFNVNWAQACWIIEEWTDGEEELEVPTTCWRVWGERT